jgi:P3 major capsid protein
MATPNVPAQAAPRMTPQQQDAIATRAILASAVDRIQLVTSEQVSPPSNPVLIVQPINVGLVKRYLIVCEGSITNSGTVPITITDFGMANLFGPGGIQYTDLNNYLRVNTSGAHLTMLSQAKRRRAMGSTVQDDTGGSFNGNSQSKMLFTSPAYWPVFLYTGVIGAGLTESFRAVFELPLAYTDDDLRGAVWANVLNAVQQITLTFNQNVVAVTPADKTFALYFGAAGAAASISSVKVTIYQEYLDQLPKAQGPQGVTTILPALSLSTVYELKSTIFSSITANQEFYMPYANQRSFISTFATFNTDGTDTGKGNPVANTVPVNYWALLAANASYIWKLDPLTVTMKSRDHTNSDLPFGTYYFPSRRKNIATLQYGNLQLTLNAANATAEGYCNVMWEAFALQNTLQSGASLASGG